MAKIPVGIKLLIDNISFGKLSTWGLSSSVSKRMNELIGENSSTEDRRRAFKQAIIEGIRRDLNG